jgi:hypothetical protein
MDYKEYIVKVYPNGNKFWHHKGLLHREDGPAIESLEGNKEWWINGVLHREDGPALEYANGHREWWIKGEEYSEKNFLSRKQRNSCDGKIVEIDGVKYKLKMVE